MVNVSYEVPFQESYKKIKDGSFKLKIKKQITKIIKKPETGKPMRHARKGTREVYAKPYRISYAYLKNEIVFLDIYHKDEQ